MRIVRYTAPSEGWERKSEQRRRASGASQCVRTLYLIGWARWKGDGECAALIFAPGLHADVATVQI